MRRVKVIPLAMAAALAGAINMVNTETDPASAASDHITSAVSGTGKAAHRRYALLASNRPAGAAAGAASARSDAQLIAQTKRERAAAAQVAALRRAAAAKAAADRAAAAKAAAAKAAAEKAAAEKAAAEQAAAEKAAAAKLAATEWVCPVQGGGLNFIDSFGYARSGGRGHQGIDMMAAYGTPTVAPVSGRVEHRYVSLGGYAWFLHGDDGNEYYGAHLSSYAGPDGWVAKGTVIGYVGNSGNASGGAPHLHFEMHPGGGAAVDPYSTLARWCPGAS